jgi:Putative RNA methylase family UPF0020
MSPQEIMTDENFIKKLSKSIRESFRQDYKESSENKDYFDSKVFFDQWFRKYGKSYHFVFRKNLKVTNIQFPELVSLIRQFHENNGNDKFSDLQFLSVKEFQQEIWGIVNSFSSVKDKKEKSKFIAEKYYDILEKCIVIDCFYGSCAVFTPLNLTLNLKSICAYSGYIHNCGMNIYIRNTEKASKDELFKKLDTYVNTIEDDKKVWFEVHAQSRKQKLNKSLRDGHDELKIHVEKFYMGGNQLSKVLSDLEIKYKDQLIVNSNGLSEISESKDRNLKKSLCLLIDNAINFSSLEKGEKQYFICYEQLYKNTNPFYVFKEDKPAKSAPVTIPNTLLGAMINIAEPFSIKCCKLMDPFAGTGTTYFEAIKYESIERIQFYDNDKFCKFLFEDNIKFFKCKIEDLKQHTEDLIQYVKFLELSSRDREDERYEIYNSVIEFIEENIDDIERFRISDETHRFLSGIGFLGRLIFYVRLRVIWKYYVKPYGNRKEDLDDFCIREIEFLINQIEKFVNIKHACKNSQAEDDRILVFQGKKYYSECCMIDFDKILSSNKYVYTTEDACNIEGSREYNIIVTDPPYGFNVDINPKKLADIYANVLERMIKLLVNNGQLIISLPNRSYNGQNLYFFCQKDFIIRQVLSIAKKCDKEVVFPAYSLPHQNALFRPPYYWNSSHTLSRSILHFRFRDLKPV